MLIKLVFFFLNKIPKTSNRTQAPLLSLATATPRSPPPLPAVRTHPAPPVSGGVSGCGAAPRRRPALGQPRRCRVRSGAGPRPRGAAPRGGQRGPARPHPAAPNRRPDPFPPPPGSLPRYRCPCSSYVASPGDASSVSVSW